MDDRERFDWRLWMDIEDMRALDFVWRFEGQAALRSSSGGGGRVPPGMREI